ncbi:hypothetical protein [Paenarthrobacter sp. YJN-5]|uniref:hypothetical protein n=1 Tax=Paenarthrobacter sp. YJN-5 TaxID=2735316 RepID=UPI0018786F56|nr:hypothetical protein [Paenarthrobacter sp. YJN-5]QOT16791.1 hypothetical protein HMI59_09375 [Paenarthrobacter sp. YJN-5]
MTTAALPELWSDWCAVARVPEDRIDDASLQAFALQSGPSKAVLDRLRRAAAPAGESSAATAWPTIHSRDPSSLRRLLARGDVLVRDRGTDWQLRLRLRRMLFVAVLIAPASHGGLGLTRSEIRQLRPEDVQRLRPRIGVAEDPASCPACAVWSWLEVIGTNSGWSRTGLRSLAHRRDDQMAGHRHELPDPSPDWLTCVGVLPAIDRWGWMDPYSSLHPSSMSVVVRAIDALLDGPGPMPTPEPEPRAPVREFTDAEREEVYARADELTARVAAILVEYEQRS